MKIQFLLRQMQTDIILLIKNGGLDFLNSIPNSNNLDFGYAEFVKNIDAIIMERKTFEVVCNSDSAYMALSKICICKVTEEY